MPQFEAKIAIGDNDLIEHPATVEYDIIGDDDVEIIEVMAHHNDTHVNIVGLLPKCDIDAFKKQAIKIARQNNPPSIEDVRDEDAFCRLKELSFYSRP